MSLSPMFTFWAFAFVATVAAQGNAVDQKVQSITPVEDIAHPIYEFVYEVGPRGGSTGDFGHTESRDGGRTWGSYFQRLPDGRLQTVKYWADESGYHAEIEYEGTAKPYTGPVEEAKGQRQHQGSPQIAALLESFPTEFPKTTPRTPPNTPPRTLLRILQNTPATTPPNNIPPRTQLRTLKNAPANFAQSTPTKTPPRTLLSTLSNTPQRSNEELIDNLFAGLRGRNQVAEQDRGQRVLQAIPIQIYSKRKQGRES